MTVRWFGWRGQEALKRTHQCLIRACRLGVDVGEMCDVAFRPWPVPRLVTTIEYRVFKARMNVISRRIECRRLGVHTWPEEDEL